ncbi:hypothetical protein [Martelella sp. HB161492]|uniref:hypothetical protein n=1 Tax=Martelella sp. HB161492 TaxID=2720726 RepID=UPI001591FAB0|nr:hypothetical protein [Martelella sp. HB161492]
MKPTAIAIFKVSAPIVVFATAFLALGTYLTRETCIILPDGSMIGYRAILLTQRDDGLNIVLKRPDGTVVLTHDSDVRISRHPTDPDKITIHYPGGRLNIDGREIMPIIASDMFSDGWNSPSHPLGESLFMTNLYGIYYWLQEGHWGETRYCGTKFLAFHKPD